MPANRLCTYEVNLMLKAKKNLDKGHKIRYEIFRMLALSLTPFDGVDKTKEGVFKIGGKK